jgi:hypothetical protein
MDQQPMTSSAVPTSQPATPHGSSRIGQIGVPVLYQLEEGIKTWKCKLATADNPVVIIKPSDRWDLERK